MNQTKQDEAKTIVAAFLDEHHNPTTDDWKGLMDRYPQHASAFVDAALIRRIGDEAEASGEEYVLDEELANRTVSRALSKAQSTPGSNLDAALRQVESIRGPVARRNAAVAVGIGPRPSLLNGVLSGRTSAPLRLLRALEKLLEVPAMAIQEVLRRAFVTSVVPAHKAGVSKPKVSVEPASWEEAVRALKLPAEETARLLKFAEKD